jgi:hypothetical protein
MSRRSSVLGAVVLAAMLAACATGPQGPLVPLIGGWEHYFKLEWEPAERKGHPIVRGYLMNDWGMPAARVRLLVDTLSADGGLLGQQVAWVGAGVLMPGMRTYFEVPVAQPGPTYRVSVFSYDWIDEPHRRWPWF